MTNPDYEAIKTRQRTAWGAGNYAVVGVTLQIVGETLCEALDVRAGERLLDVAGGNGNVSLAAARRYCDVTCTDYVPTLLADAQRRAAAEGLQIATREADAEALPFDSESFDVATSCFGAMFAPNHCATASELMRVVRPGGRIGMANWTPDSFIGCLFKVLGAHVPPPAGVPSPALWGTEAHVRSLFPQAQAVELRKRTFTLRYRSHEHWLDTWRTVYGPLERAFASLSAEDGSRLADNLAALAATQNVATDGTMVVPSTYAEVIVHR